jgi:tetratricopeptide (TPR) repeat protein
VTQADEDRLALAGYLPPLAADAADAPALLEGDHERVAEAHHAAAVLVGERRFSAGIRALQAIVRDHPQLAVVQYQIGTLLARTGRVGEAVGAFRAAGELRPNAVEIHIALADALMRDGRTAEALLQAEAAIELAGTKDSRAVADAHGVAARIALARGEPALAARHAEAVVDADPGSPMTEFVEGRVLYDAGRYEDALDAFERAAAVASEHRSPLPELNMYLGEALSHLDRYAEAEAAFREELSLFPHHIQAYTSLAMLYRAMNRDEAVEDVLSELVEAAPTPEGYAVAARLWTILGERTRAEALRSDARARFRGDPSLVLLGRDARR